MKFTKPIPYNPGEMTLGPVSMKIWFFLKGSETRIKLNSGTAALIPGSGWDDIVSITSSLILDGTTLQIDASLKRSLTINEYQGLVLSKKAIPIRSNLAPEASLPGMGIPVPVGGAPVVDEIDVTIPSMPEPELWAKPEYAGLNSSGNPQTYIVATVNLPLKFTDSEIASLVQKISISISGTEAAVIPGDESVVGIEKKRLFIAKAEKDVMKKASVMVTVSATIFGKFLKIEVPLEFESAYKYALCVAPAKTIHVTEKETATISAKVMSIDENGIGNDVPDSVISLDVPLDTSEYLSVSPVRGTGLLNATIKQIDKTERKDVSLTLSASVQNEEISDKPTITVIFGKPTTGPIKTQFENDKNKISPFIANDRTVLMARVESEDGEPLVALWTFKLANSKGWLDEPSSQTVYGEGWTAVALQATSPDPNNENAEPPASEDVLITAEIDGKTIGNVTVPVILLPRPKIEADRYQVSLVKGTKGNASVNIQIIDGGEESWDIIIDEERSPQKLASASIKKIDNTNAELTITELEVSGERTDDTYESEKIVIRGMPPSGILNFPLECHIQVIIQKEGLFINKTGQRDGMYYVPVPIVGEELSKILMFSYYYLNDEGEIVREIPSITPPNDLIFTIFEEEGSKSYNVALASKLHIEYQNAGLTFANYAAFMQRPIPGDGRPIAVTYRATVQDHKGKEETGYCEFTLGLETLDANPGSASWEIEVERCKKIINVMAPDIARPELLELVEKRKRVLGVEGLVKLRWQIYDRAYRLNIEEAKDYLDQANDYDTIIEVLEWVKWAGDLAFNTALSPVLGPYIAACNPAVRALAPILVNQIKGKVLLALEAYQNDWTLEQFFNKINPLSEIFGIIESKVVDVDRLEWGVQLIMDTPKARIIAWGAFAGYHFFKGIYYGVDVGKPERCYSVVCAATQTAKEIRDEALVNWLGHLVATQGQKNLKDVNWFGTNEKGSGDKVKTSSDGKKIGDQQKPVDGEKVKVKEGDQQKPVDGEKVKVKEGDQQKPVDSEKVKVKEGDQEKPVDGEKVKVKEGDQEKPVDGEKVKVKEGDQQKPVDGEKVKVKEGDLEKPVDGEKVKVKEGDLEKPVDGEKVKVKEGDQEKPVDGEKVKVKEGDQEKPVDGEKVKVKEGDQQKPTDAEKQTEGDNKEVKNKLDDYKKAKDDYEKIPDKNSKEAIEARKELDAKRADLLIEKSKGKVDEAEKSAYINGINEGRKKINELKDSWEKLQSNPNDPAAQKAFEDACEKVQQDKHAMTVLNDEPHNVNGKTCKPGEQSPLRRDFNEHWNGVYEGTHLSTRQRLLEQANKNLRPGEKPYTLDDIQVAQITNVKDSKPKTPDEKSIRCTLDQDVTYRITKRVKKVVDGKEVKDPKTGLPVWEDVKGSMEDISPDNKFVRNSKGEPIIGEDGKPIEEKGTGARDIYNQEFYKTQKGDYPYKIGPDGKPVIDQDACNRYAEDMDQSVNDEHSAESYGGGQEDIKPATRGDMKGKPYKDVVATSKAMEYKVNEWYGIKADKKGISPEARVAYKKEGMRQLTKQYRNQIVPVINKYNELANNPNPPVVKIPDNVRTGFEIMERVGRMGLPLQMPKQLWQR